MKKLYFLASLLFVTVLVQAQGGKVSSAMTNIKPEYYELDKAQESIDAAILHEKTKGKAKTWKVRGQVYLAIGQTEDENFKKLSDNPLQISLESFEKCQDLDIKHKYDKEIKIHLLTLSSAFFNQGGAYYQENNFAKSFKCFESSYLVSKMLDSTTIDTVAVFNAATTANKAQMYPEAVKYYKIAADYKYNGASTYVSIAYVQREMGDTAAFLATLQEGVGEFPEDNYAIILELINYYLLNDQAEEALKYLEQALVKDPQNHTLHFAKGTLFDKMGDFEQSKACYEKAVEIKPDYFDAYYNLGALFFNKGREMLIAANDIPPSKPKEYDAAVKESFKEFEKALPYLEKAHEITPGEESTSLTLKEIYFKLRNDKPEYLERYNAIKAELDNK